MARFRLQSMRQSFCRGGVLRRFRCDDGGGVSPASALLAVPLVLSFICIAELGVACGSYAMLESGVDSAGQVLGSVRARDKGDLRGAFETRLCELTATLLDCDRITYETIVLNAETPAASAAMAARRDAPEGRVFRAGAPGQTVMLRAAYRFEFTLPVLSRLLPLAGADEGDAFVSTRIVRNEPDIALQ